MTLLHFALDGRTTVLGHSFEGQLFDAPEEIVAAVLANPLFREATDAERAGFKSVTTKKARKGATSE